MEGEAAVGLGRRVEEPRPGSSLGKLPASEVGQWEAISLDLGAEGLGSSPGSHVKTPGNFLTSLGFCFSHQQNGLPQPLLSLPLNP